MPGWLFGWLVCTKFQNSSNETWIGFAIYMALEIAEYFRDVRWRHIYIWQIFISKFKRIFQVFWAEIDVKGKDVLILNAVEPSPACQGTRGLKGNGRSATLGTESETRPPGQNILTLYCVWSNFKYTWEEYTSRILFRDMDKWTTWPKYFFPFW